MKKVKQERSLVKDSNVSSLLRKIVYKFCIYMMYETAEEVIIEFNDDGTSEIELLRCMRHVKFKLNKEGTNEIKKRIDEIDILSWKRKYTFKEQIILDGFEWSLKLEYKDGKRKYKGGINEFPDNIDELESFMKYLHSIY